MNTRTFAARLLAAVLTVTTAGVVALESPAAAAITGCPKGSSKHCYGLGRLYQNNNLHAVGANLYVDCLAVTNRSTDFVNMEMWLTTQNTRPLNQQNWVEAGMTSGTLYSSPGHEKGFIWYWADSYTNLGHYYEHYIGGATAGSTTNVTFNWEGPQTWGVYKGGKRVGGSGVGAYPGDVDLGAESTTYQTAVWGHGLDWQYKNIAGTWNWVSPSIVTTGSTIKAAAASGSGRAHARVNVSTPTWKCGGKPPALRTAVAADAATLLQTDEGTDELLRDKAAQVAAAVGADDLGAIRYVKSTREAAVSRTSETSVQQSSDDTSTGDPATTDPTATDPSGTDPDGADPTAADPTADSSAPADDRAVYVVQTEGSFVKDVGHDKDPVQGNVLEMVIDAQTGELTDWGILRDTNGFASLGPAKVG